MTANYNVAAHYALHAYVMPGQVQRLEPHGRVTFVHIYQNRPPDARYAVAEEYKNKFIVWDLFETTVRITGAQILASPTPAAPRFTHDDLDAAIAATVLLYGKEA